MSDRTPGEMSELVLDRMWVDPDTGKCAIFSATRDAYCTCNSNLTLQVSCRGDTQIVDWYPWNSLASCVHKVHDCLYYIVGPGVCAANYVGRMLFETCKEDGVQQIISNYVSLGWSDCLIWPPVLGHHSMTRKSEWIAFVSGSCVHAFENVSLVCHHVHCMVHKIHGICFVDISIAGRRVSPPRHRKDAHMRLLLGMVRHA